MSIFKRDFNIDELINITPAGLVVADFNKIRDSLIMLNKKIYGNEIDMSGESPDVQYLTSIALIINNILQLTQYAYKNMDPSTAEGRYLDILCQLTNIKRHNRTKSQAQLYVKNVSGEVISPDKINFIDRTGNTWTWTNPSVYGGQKLYSWAINEVKIIDNVYCDNYGQIKAFGNNTSEDISRWNFDDIENNGDIYQTIDFGTFQVLQIDDAIPGQNKESDNDLRLRRIMSLGTQSVSVLDGLRAALLDIAGIKDCWIYNNIDIADKIMDDNSKIALHDIYICLRYIDGVDVPDSTIGELIYNKLTPGIKTSKGGSTNPTYGKIRDYAIKKSDNYQYHIYWKKCTPIPLQDAQIKIYATILENLYDYPNTLTEHTAKTDVEISITNEIINYLNNIQLGEKFMATMLYSAIQSADITKNNLSTFIVNGGDNELDGVTLSLSLSYFYVKPENVYFTYNNKTSLTITIK